MIGTSPTMAMMEILRDQELEKAGLNVKVIFAPSRDLFMRQSKEYQDSVLNEAEWQDAMVDSNAGRRLERDWIPNKVNEDCSITPDYDNDWRTGTLPRRDRANDPRNAVIRCVSRRSV